MQTPGFHLFLTALPLCRARLMRSISILSGVTLFFTLADFGRAHLFRNQVSPPQRLTKFRVRSQAHINSKPLVGYSLRHRDDHVCLGRSSLISSNVRPPQNAMEVYVVGKQWMWKIQHATGQREINELHVPVGRKDQTDHDHRRRDSRLLHSGVSHQGRRRPGQIHNSVVRSDESRDDITSSAPNIAA